MDMEKEKLFEQIKGGLIVSCQALETEPLYTKEGGVMPLMAKAAAMSGAVGIRANTVRDITQIKQVVDLPVIGIIKKDYPGTPMYITVTMKEVDELVACGVDILAVQGTGAHAPRRLYFGPVHPRHQGEISRPAAHGGLRQFRERHALRRGRR